MTAKSALAAALVGAPALGLVFLLLLVTGGSSTALPTGDLCPTTGPITGLDATKAQNARTVASVADARGGRRAVLIAEVTALTESGLRVLGNSAQSSARGLPAQGFGHDHDSLGLFQQRASWGSAAARMDPIASTNLFMNALLRVQGWSSLPAWAAAQEVQRSAYTGMPSISNGQSAVIGGNYLERLPEARRIVDVIALGAVDAGCGGGVGRPPGGAKGAFGLPVAYRLPTATSPRARVAVLFALAQRGKPYIWGAAGPDGYDCSGLMHAAWAAAGVQVTHYTGAEVSEGTAITPAALQAGDLVLVPGNDGTLASPGHVGMYIGDGLVVHAPEPGDVVRVVTYPSFTAEDVSALRHIA